MKLQQVLTGAAFSAFVLFGSFVGIESAEAKPNFTHRQSTGGSETHFQGSSSSYGTEFGRSLEVKQFSDQTATMDFSVKGSIGSTTQYDINGRSGSPVIDPLNILMISEQGFNKVSTSNEQFSGRNWSTFQENSYDVSPLSF